MPTIARTDDVLARVRASLDEAARAAAGNNELLSRDEQATLAHPLLEREAEAIRTEGGAGTRVVVTDLVERASSAVARLLGQVNQPSGSGAGSISRAEIQALAGLDVDAAVLVAAAYQLLTGRSAELDGAAPVDPPAPPAPPALVGKLTPSAVELSPTPPFGHPPPVVRADGAIVMPKMAELTSTFSIDVGGRRIDATLPANETMSGRVTNVATSADLVEAVRRAAPDLFVHVVENKNGVTAIELWDTPPPHPTTPTYLFAQMRDASDTKINGLELRGPLTFVANNADVPSGTTMTLRLDDKVYTATVGPNRKAGDLMRLLRDQLVADGHGVTLKEYSRMAPWTLRVDS